MRELEYGYGYTATISVEILDFFSTMPGFGEVGYIFVDMICCKQSIRPLNETVVTMLPKENYIVRQDPPDGDSITVSRAVMKRWSLKNNKEVNESISDDDGDDRSSYRKS